MADNQGFSFSGQLDHVARSLKLPFATSDLIDKIVTGTASEAGRRALQVLFTTWDMTGGGPFAASAAGALGAGKAVDVLLDLFLGPVFEPVLKRLGSDEIRLRATLSVSQLVGVGVMRYNVKIEPLASMPRDRLIDILAPTLNRYITGELTPAEKSGKK